MCKAISMEDIDLVITGSKIKKEVLQEFKVMG